MPKQILAVTLRPETIELLREISNGADVSMSQTVQMALDSVFPMRDEDATE